MVILPYTICIEFLRKCSQIPIKQSTSSVWRSPARVATSREWHLSSPMFSVNFTNRKNSAVLNYHKSWSWSNQPVLWDFYIMFLLVSSLWMFVTIFYPKHGVTGDVWRHNILTFHAASVENRREKSLRVSSLLELKYTSTLSCRRYDETKKLFCTR